MKTTSVAPWESIMVKTYLQVPCVAKKIKNKDKNNILVNTTLVAPWESSMMKTHLWESCEKLILYVYHSIWEYLISYIMLFYPNTTIYTIHFIFIHIPYPPWSWKRIGAYASKHAFGKNIDMVISFEHILSHVIQSPT